MAASRKVLLVHQDKKLSYYDEGFLTLLKQQIERSGIDDVELVSLSDLTTEKLNSAGFILPYVGCSASIRELPEVSKTWEKHFKQLPELSGKSVFVYSMNTQKPATHNDYSVTINGVTVKGDVISARYQKETAKSPEEKYIVDTSRVYSIIEIIKTKLSEKNVQAIKSETPSVVGVKKEKEKEEKNHVKNEVVASISNTKKEGETEGYDYFPFVVVKKPAPISTTSPAPLVSSVEPPKNPTPLPSSSMTSAQPVPPTPASSAKPMPPTLTTSPAPLVSSVEPPKNPTPLPSSSMTSAQPVPPTPASSAKPIPPVSTSSPVSSAKPVPPKNVNSNMAKPISSVPSGKQKVVLTYSAGDDNEKIFMELVQKQLEEKGIKSEVMALENLSKDVANTYEYILACSGFAFTWEFVSYSKKINDFFEKAPELAKKLTFISPLFSMSDTGIKTDLSYQIAGQKVNQAIVATWGKGKDLAIISIDTVNTIADQIKQTVSVEAPQEITPVPPTNDFSSSAGTQPLPSSFYEEEKSNEKNKFSAVGFYAPAKENNKSKYVELITQCVLEIDWAGKSTSQAGISAFFGISKKPAAVSDNAITNFFRGEDKSLWAIVKSEAGDDDKYQKIINLLSNTKDKKSHDPLFTKFLNAAKEGLSDISKLQAFYDFYKEPKNQKFIKL